MKLFTTLLIATLTSVAAIAAPTAHVVIAVGAPGNEEYRTLFDEAAEAWQKAAAIGKAEVTIIGFGDPATDDLAALQSAINSDPEDTTPLWIALIGHGTYDGRQAKFNLRGSDLTDTKTYLPGSPKPLNRPVAIINTTAASAPFLKTLSGENRVIITATKSASEDSFARFGQYLAPALATPEADLDGDGGTSLLEAFLKAAEDVAEFYEKEGRIATEEALIDDNGDGQGTPASWFRGTRATRTAKEGASPDGNRAHQLHLSPSKEELLLTPEQRNQRNTLEAELFALRAKKETLPEDTYYSELERIARALANIYANPTPQSEGGSRRDRR